MKKIISIILAVFMMTSFSSIAVQANDISDTIRIEFCVGDDTLLINNNIINVEKPYVTDDGVTLVPLRVITEAFGATVEWIESEQCVNLTYPDVFIRLHIGSTVAEVNGKNENLLSAAELTNNHTMVPLRFISETFGATVTYDDATQKIVVIKENIDYGSTVIGKANGSRIGDSFYGWSMENSANMQLDYRSFNGSYLSYTLDGGGYMTINVKPLNKNYDFEKNFLEYKSDLQIYTLIKADKDTSDPDKKTMHFRARFYDSIIDERIVITDKYSYVIYANINNDEQKDENLRIISTFDADFCGEDIYDYSDVKNGYRDYSVDWLGLSFAIPGDYYEADWLSTENQYVFYPDDNEDYYSQIAVCVYSKDDVGTAEEAANDDYNINKRDMNSEVATFSDGVKTVLYGDRTVYEYTYTIDAFNEKTASKDVFFEVGEYVYNFYFCNLLPADNLESISKAVINSIKAEELSTDEIGCLMRNSSESTGTFVSEINDITFEVPNNYSENSDGTSGAYMNASNNILFNVSTEKKNNTLPLLKTEINKLETEFEQDYNAEVVQSVTETKIGGKDCIKLVYLLEEEGEKVYMEVYGVEVKDCGYIVMAIYPELAYSQYARSEIEHAVSSMK